MIFHQSGKFSLSRKFRVDNSECYAITVTKKVQIYYKIEILVKVSFIIIRMCIFFIILIDLVFD